MLLRCSRWGVGPHLDPQTSVQNPGKEVSISDIALILRAAEFAAHKHCKQRRKGKTRRPYIDHCIEVAGILADVGKVETGDVLAAAFLHDTVEDAKTTREELRREFGSAIDDLVAQVTDDEALDKDDRKKAQVEEAPTLSDGAKLIRLADRISNVLEVSNDPPKGWDIDRREKYFAESKRVVAALAGVNADLERTAAEALSEASNKLAKEKEKEKEKN